MAGGTASGQLDTLQVVGIGASAGGLDAFQKFCDAMPSDSGMAFILIQHLDPTHESLMVELLARHTPMRVQHAAAGMRLEPDCVYVIPPGVYLSVSEGALRLSEPQERHGARLPFDFLLRSLAQEFGARSVCAILSGTGADGSRGLKAVKEAGGLVIAQDPDEAEYGGMPESAIMTGAVDLVLPVAEIPDALVKYRRRVALARVQNGPGSKDAADEWLPEIVELLRATTAHDFRLYKPGTLQRRIERRMAMAATETDDMNRYVDLLRNDPNELDLLAKDLLINVTTFFRDPEVFDFLAEKIVPDLISKHSSDNPVRVWVVGCSTGEEAYSLAILLHEQIRASKHNAGLQIFASDADPKAVAIAREGLYPLTIEADISPDRLARFFTKEEHGYRVLSELRAAVVFTVQDVLVDPPFSRLDMISCRNLLIYLQPEAQAKVTDLFSFALRENGILLLGQAESANNIDRRFKPISKSARIYRHMGQSRPGEFGRSLGADEGPRLPRIGQGQAPSRHAMLAELSRRLMLETHAPAAILVNHEHECLYSMGPIDRFLRTVPGYPTRDLFAMAREGVNTKLRSAVQQAVAKNARVVVGGGRITRNGEDIPFRIDAQPVQNEGEDLLWICFIEEAERERKHDRAVSPKEASRVAELEGELEETRAELEAAVRDLERSTDAQKEIAEEALSVNEEFQAANEELLTSKEELQSLNEELTALNTQLQETLERQRTTANDLQNILYSTDVATLFLDSDLNIRFFTPAVRSLFHVLPGDIGRPLADLSSMSSDDDLLADARNVIETLVPVEREIEGRGGTWYIRRTLPYRTQDDGVEGVVITYNDITDRKRVADALDAAKQQADEANIAKSRFLAAASHDLRQPLQTLSLIQGLLAKTAKGERTQELVARLGEISAAMSSMLNALLDINQIETGTVQAEPADFPVNDLFERLKDEFVYFAGSKGLDLRVVPCGLSVRSDPQLLEQMIRNLLSNALKYTSHGRVLLGCRRRGPRLSIEVWDTGIGIDSDELERVFGEYYQIDNAARERSRGLGLGLSIVQRLADLLGHRLHARSRSGKGSVFAIEVDLTSRDAASGHDRTLRAAHGQAGAAAVRAGEILVIEDDPDVRELLELVLEAEGFYVSAAHDGAAALDLLANDAFAPDLIIADYNLPNEMNGLDAAARVCERLHREIPVIVLTGDISSATLREIPQRGATHLNKPVKPTELTNVIQRLLSAMPAAAPPAPAPHHGEAAASSAAPVVYVVDDESEVREELCGAMRDRGWIAEGYESAEAFLETYQPGREACLLLDAALPGLSGLELLERLADGDHRLTTVMITGKGNVHMAVQAMRAGAFDFVEKPVSRDELLAAVEHALEKSRDSAKFLAWRDDAASRLARLTPRQREILDLILAGHPNKNIAADLGISQRTVENHRASIMKRTGSRSLPELARLALVSAEAEFDGRSPPTATSPPASGS